ncbi:FAD-binding oxidoreductase [Nocardioides aestuarii]|uniref:FAD-binding oxidoreductase n=1 Tax=Nocardioides aestuarii TaxID=252231 RepID=A0ABW4TML5_9ACTN
MTTPVLGTRPVTHEPLAPLRELCGGDVHLPGDPGYDAARSPWAVAVDQRPAAVAFPRTPTDVAAVVRCAAELGLRVAPQSTGHNAGPLAGQGLDDVVLLQTRHLDEVSVDLERGIVRVGGGVTWEPVVAAAAAVGRSVLHGSSPDVGVVGYTLGGGMGWYARQHGLSAHHVVAVELVDARGELVRADADHHPELFWAVRGGGGSFGVVTALELRLLDHHTAFGGMMVWDLTRAPEVLPAWAAWAETAPDCVTTSLRLFRLPPMPELPDFLRGRELVVVDGAVLGTDEDAEAVLAPLRALEPEIDTFARVPAAALVRIHMDPEGPTPAASGTLTLAELPTDAMERMLDLVGPGRTSPLLLAELRQLGGAVGRPHPDAGVLTHLDGAFLLFAVGIAATPEMGAAAHAAAAELVAAMAPWGSDRTYLNFEEEPTDARRGYPAGAWEVLQGVRSAVDPDGRFVGNHPVPRLHEEQHRDG